MLKRFTTFLLNGLSRKVRIINSVKLISRKGGVPVKFLEAILHRISFILLGRSDSGRRAFLRFIQTVVKLVKTHGDTFTVKYLKACHVALMRYIAGDPVRSLREIEPDFPFMRTINGLPVLIPVAHRRAIREVKYGRLRFNGVRWFVFWSSLFSVYRVLAIPGKVKLSTITAQPSFETTSILRTMRFMPTFKSMLVKLHPGFETIDLSQRDWTVGSSSTGPNRDNSLAGAVTDAFAWFYTYKELLPVFHYYCLATFSEPLYYKMFSIVAERRHLRKENKRLWDDIVCNETLRARGDLDLLVLGRLASKLEPAGKVRLFAIVDFWTQALLKPLHEGLFDLIKYFPNDGTFNQEAAAERAILKATKSGYAASFDLSAATDRLPLVLQSNLLTAVLPPKYSRLRGGKWTIGMLWSSLLVDRPYLMKDGSEVMYSTGQPMGALSSWAMLALTHHFILQFLSNSLGGSGWNEDYEVLGDDIVITDKKLADAYYEFMTQQLGVEIGLHKSLISKSTQKVKVIEFAKKLLAFVDGKVINLSALPAKMFLSNISLTARLETLSFLRRSGWISNFSEAARVLSVGIKEYYSLMSSGWTSLGSLRRVVLLNSLRINKDNLSGSIESVLAKPFMGLPLAFDQWLNPAAPSTARLPSTRQMMVERNLKDLILTRVMDNNFFSAIWPGNVTIPGQTPLSLRILSLQSDMTNYLNSLTSLQKVSVDQLLHDLQPFMVAFAEIGTRVNRKVDYVEVDSATTIRWLFKTFKMERELLRQYEAYVRKHPWRKPFVKFSLPEFSRKIK